MLLSKITLILFSLINIGALLLAVLNLWLPLFPITPTWLVSLVCLGIALLSGTYGMRAEAIQRQQIARQNARLQRSLGTPIDEATFQLAKAELPTLLGLLLRNFVVSLVFAPLVVLAVVIGERLFLGAFAVGDIPLRVVALGMVFALIMVILFAWRGIAQGMDRWVLRRDQPLLQEVTPSAKDSKTNTKSKPSNWQHDPLKDLYKVYHFRKYKQKLVIVSCMSLFIILFVLSLFTFENHFHLSFLLISLFLLILYSFAEDLPKLNSWLILGLNKNHLLNPRTQTLLRNYEKQLAQAKYSHLHQRLEQAKAIYIDWETMFITAELDIYTGEIKRGLDIMNQLLDSLVNSSHRPTEEAEILYQQMIFRTLQLQLEALLLQRNYSEANALVEQLLQFKGHFDFSYANNTLAALYLFQGEREQAVNYLVDARQANDHQLASRSPYHIILWAWSAAYQHHLELADRLIRSAFENSNPKFKLYHSRIYLIAGFARRELGQTDLMRLMFEQATRIDPEGVYGKLARRELEASSPNVAKLKREEPSKLKSSLN